MKFTTLVPNSILGKFANIYGGSNCLASRSTKFLCWEGFICSGSAFFVLFFFQIYSASYFFKDPFHPDTFVLSCRQWILSGNSIFLPPFFICWVNKNRKINQSVSVFVHLRVRCPFPIFIILVLINWCNFLYFKMTSKKSELWKHFIKVNESVAECKICKSHVKSSGNTTNLKQHLNRRHQTLVSVLLLWEKRWSDLITISFFMWYLPFSSLQWRKTQLNRQLQAHQQMLSLQREADDFQQVNQIWKIKGLIWWFLKENLY